MFMLNDIKLMSYLTQIYSSPNRHYHNLNHIYHMLSKMEEYKNANPEENLDYKALEIAIWFHDIYYSPYKTNPSNEVRSADLLYRWFEKCMDYSELFHSVKLAGECILYTEHHLLELKDDPYLKEIPEASVLLDFDLSGFGENYDFVLMNSDNVTKEFRKTTFGMSIRDLYKGRIDFLNKLLSKSRIYYTDYFYKNYEDNARMNIENVIRDTETVLKTLPNK